MESQGPSSGKPVNYENCLSSSDFEIENEEGTPRDSVLAPRGRS